MYQYIPNILSVLRILFSVLLILLINQPIGFIFLYFITGLTDILDGFLARKLKAESELGAKLDSLADLVFYIILVYIFIKLYPSIFTTNLKWAVIGIVLVRLFNLFLTKIKYKKFVFVHTIANKVSGILLFFLPIIVLFEQSVMIIWITLGIAFIAALEELCITIRYPEAHLNRKSLFSQR